MNTDSPTTPPPIAFVDTETTGLDWFFHDAWEIAVILRRDDHDHEHVFHIKPDLANAHPKALEVGRYHERTSTPDWQWDDRQTAAQRLYALLDSAVIVGSNPAFDANMIANLFGRYYAQLTPWHYRAIDIVPLAAGFLYGQAQWLTHRDCDATWYGKVTDQLSWPWKSYQASEAVGIPRPADDVAHTALGDARWARDVWDAVVTPDAFYTATDEHLADMANEALRDLHGGAQ